MNQRPQRLAELLEREPFTLCLSAGFFGFYAHGGMLSALETLGLRPARIVGASAGAIVGGCVAAGASLADLQSFLFYLRRTDFWDPAAGAGLLRGQRFDQMLRELMPTTRVEDFETEFSCSAWSIRERRSVPLFGGDIVPSMRASAAFPLLFQPVNVGGERFLDGGIGDRPGFASLEPTERTLYHHLSTRSPWRMRGGASVMPPLAPSVLPLDLGAFRRLGPFSLGDGPKVWAEARERALRALTAPLPMPV